MLRNRLVLGNGWQLLGFNLFDELLDFLMPVEYECVPFTSSIIRDGEIQRHLLRGNRVFVELRDYKIVSAFVITAESVICPVFTNETCVDNIGRVINLRRLNKQRVLTVMGSKKNVLLLEDYLLPVKRNFIDYHLLFVRSAFAFKTTRERLVRVHPDTVRNLRVFTATKEDIDLLMPLRRAYELEEVFINKDDFVFSACKRRFLDTIINQKVFFASLGNEVVASCCINSEGLNWCCLGGVYTKPKMRSMGVSTVLINAISDYLLRKNKNLCLFVKKHNSAAIKLYEKCGFTACGEYRISYCESR